jgi:hypothetical protein
MIRLWRAFAALAFLSACTPEAPPPPTLPTTATAATAPFRAVVPKDYCLSDSSDWIDATRLQGVGSNSSWIALGVFRPCTEPRQASGATTTRIEVVTRWSGGDSPGNQLFSDRAVFLAAQKDPAIAARFRQALSPTGKYSVRDLGVDDLAVYHGLDRKPRDDAKPWVGLRLVIGTTIIDGWTLTVRIYNPTAEAAPRSWDDLKALAADIVHRTVQAAEAART